MRLLALSPYPVYPPRFGGQMRIFNLAKGLSQVGNEVTIAYSFSNFGEKIDGKTEGVYLRSFKTYIQSVGSWLNRKGFAPLIITEPFNSLLGPLFKKRLNGYEAVLFEHPFLSSWMKQVRFPSIKVYSSHNIEVDFEGMYNRKYKFRRAYDQLLAKCERRAIELSDVIIAVSEEDKVKMQQLYGAKGDKIHVVPNGFERSINYYDRDIVRKDLGWPLDKKIAIFIGSNTPPNKVAVERICNMAQQMKDVDFVLIGECSEGISPQQNIISLGEVRNPDIYLAASDMGILPIKEGSGSNIKILHYLSRGLSVVTTPFGLRGYGELESLVKKGEMSDFPELIRQTNRHQVPLEKIEKYEWKNLARQLQSILNGGIEFEPR